ncbi:conserved Plasmodium protein, unknown function [Babesia microti strain RI]|uniref:Symplekin C-terminal domain-containing protein n=1 Tax=Babesia microti (strain RI) TaxID=1133968 RepID=I7IPL3_BABMR|nr:conserved Plasmodium protein, unknown function [Babesia microti strain RI]CCF73050.1 conserved Plasmodium protein, unknown function [Babesia microti strain RI]|eukprot:XP_012647659.1 conserved Plasmodium protein, unknown function [Babesia microti strain RI]
MTSDVNRTFTSTFGLLQSGKRRKFEEEFAKIRKVQLKGGVNAKIELCKLIELVLVSDGRFSSLLITDLYNLLTDKNKNVALTALDTISLCIDTLIYNVIECHSHQDLVSEKLYIPGGIGLFKNVLADYECLRSTYSSLLKSTKSSEAIFLIYKILAAELQAFAEVDVSDYIIYDSKNHFNPAKIGIDGLAHKKPKNPNYPECNCVCKFLSKNASTISYGELKPIMFSKCTRKSNLKSYFERWREENVQLLCKYLNKDDKSDLGKIKFLMSTHVCSLVIACYPLTYNELLPNLQQLLEPVSRNPNQPISTFAPKFSEKGSIDKFVFKQLIRILASKISISLHKEISECLCACGYISGLDIIYREIHCIGSVIMECPAPFDANKVYVMSCNFEDFGGLCATPLDNNIEGKLLEKRGPIYYITKPERVELIGHLAVTKPLPKLIDMALGYDVTKNNEGRSRTDILQYSDVPACKVLYFTPDMLKFTVTTRTTNLEPTGNELVQFKQMKDNLLTESANDIGVKVASTSDVMNNFQFYSKMVVNQILKADWSLTQSGQYLDSVKRKFLNKILLDNYLEPQTVREMLTMYINSLIAKLDLNRYVKSNPDGLTLQNALSEWSNYFNCVSDILYHKSVLNYIDSTSSSLVKQECDGNELAGFFNRLHIGNNRDNMSYDELLQLCFDGFYSDKLLINRAYRDAYIKSICSFVLSIPCITDGLIERFYSLLDSLGGSLLVFSLVSNILKKSKSVGAKRRIFSLFFKALYHKTPSVRNLFYKLIESTKGLYMTFDGQTSRYSNKEFEKLHNYLSILVTNRFGESCNKCGSGGRSLNISNLEMALTPPLWQWPIEIITLLTDWIKSLGVFQSAEIQVTVCVRCKRNVFDISSDKILYNVLYMWDNLQDDCELDWHNPHYIHNIWLQETIFYIFLKCLRKYPIFQSQSDGDMPIDETDIEDSTIDIEDSLNHSKGPTGKDTSKSEEERVDNREKGCSLERFLVPNNFLKNMCDEIIENLNVGAICISINAVSEICNRSPQLLSALIYTVDSYALEQEHCNGRVCSGISEAIISSLSNLCTTHIEIFYVILENYLSVPPKTCLMGHILTNVAIKWTAPTYNIVDKLSMDSAEMRTILLCISTFKNWSKTVSIVPVVAFLPKNIAIDLLNHLFLVETNEGAVKSCIESVLSVPADVRSVMDQKVSSANQQWLSPEELLIAVYRFNNENLDRKKQAILLDHIISLVETNQRRPQNVPKNVIMSLHSVVKSCTMIVEDKQPISFIFGRLLCQVVQNVPSVRGGVVQHVMPTLVTRRAWEDKQLWRGVVISFGILWSEFKEPLTLLIFQLPQGVGEDLLQSVQQRHSVIPDMAAIVSKKQHMKAVCPRYISSILGL